MYKYKQNKVPLKVNTFSLLSVHIPLLPKNNLCQNTVAVKILQPKKRLKHI
jgi:hypothetical protein